MTERSPRSARLEPAAAAGARWAIDYASSVRLRPNTQRLLLVGLAVAAAIAAVAANWALLGYAQSSDNRVGRLSPKATLVAPGGQPLTGGAGAQPAPPEPPQTPSERAHEPDD